MTTQIIPATHEFVPDLVIWPRLLELRDCLCDAIDNRGAPAPCICTVVPGAITATEYCNPCVTPAGETCGMAWVRLDSAFPSSVFPAPDVTAVGMGCSAMLAFTVELGVVRCAPVGDEYGNPPTQDELELAAEIQIADMMAMRQAVKCCFGREKTMFGAYQPLGPDGGCVGGFWPVSVAVESYGGDVPPPITPSRVGRFYGDTEPGL